MDTEEKLVWLGVKTNAAKNNQLSGDVAQLKETVGSWNDFQIVVDSASTFTGVRNRLVNNFGWSSGDADAFQSRLEASYADFDAFDSAVESYSSYAELKSDFTSNTGLESDAQTTDGRPAAGIRVHETAGTTYSGVDVPAGTTEVYGNRIEFSSQGSVRDSRESMNYGTISTDDANNEVVVTNPITFSVDVTNPNGYRTTADITLQEDGQVTESKNIAFAANQTKTVSFTVSKSVYTEKDFQIGDSNSVTARWTPPFLR